MLIALLVSVSQSQFQPVAGLRPDLNCGSKLVFDTHKFQKTDQT